MSEWKTYKWGDLISLEYGKPIPDKNLLDGQYPVYGTNGRIGTSNLTPLCKHPSIIVGRKGAYRGVHYSNKPFSVIDTAFFIEPKTSILDLKWAYYKLLTVDINKMDSGSAIPSTDRYEIYSLSVELPPLEEQQRIAGILGSLDDKIELNRRINANLEAQAQALFQSWFVDFEPFRDGPFVDSELGKIPASLKIEHIGNIPHKIESGKRPKGGASEHGIPSIGAENIKGLGIYDYAKTKFIPEDFASTMKKGKINGYELLIYKDGGKPGYFIPNFTIFGEGFPYKEMYINEHVFCLDFFDKGFNTFAYFYMRTPYIMNQLNTIGGKAAIPGINTKDIESLPIFTNENEKVKEFGTLFLPTIKTILQNCVENKTLSALRDTLLPKLIAGEI